MNDDDVLVLIYEGPYVETMFVKMLIEGSGIATSFDDLPQRSVPFTSRLFVRRADVEAAAVLVADFRENGRRSSP